MGLRRLGAATRRLAACALALAHAATAAPAPRLVDAGPVGQSMQYYIDAETVRRQGEVIHYRLHGRGVDDAASRQIRSEAEVGVRCSERERVLFVSTVRWPGGVRTTTSSEMTRVLPGSREEVELQVACIIAESGPPASVAHGLLEGQQSPGSIGRSTGTGFAVTRDRLVTNRHVVNNCRSVRVLHGDSSHPAQVLAQDASRDLALLRIPGDGLVPLVLAHRPRDLGEPITILGYPLAEVLGPSVRVSTGIVSALAGLRNDRRMLQITAPVQPGNSGSPVLDEQGHLVGVVVTRLDARLNTQNVSFALQLPVLREFLQAHKVAFETAPAPRRLVSLPVADVVRKVAGGVVLVSCE